MTIKKRESSQKPLDRSRGKLIRRRHGNGYRRKKGTRKKKGNKREHNRPNDGLNAQMRRLIAIGEFPRGHHHHR